MFHYAATMLAIISDAATVRSLIVSQSFRLVLAAIGVLLMSSPALSQSDQATPLSRVRGEVVMLTSELVVVKSTDGTNILIPLEKKTTVDASLKIGERVEVVATPDHHVTSVKKLTPDPFR